MRHRVMMMGPVGAGKTTLTNALLEIESAATKTQTLSYKNWIVDTPGEYMENPYYYKTIMATALEVTHLIFLFDATKTKLAFPPGFSQGFTKLPIGVITKSDHPEADVERTLKILRMALPKGPVVVTSAKTGTGLDHIKQLVSCSTALEMREYARSHSSEIFV